MDGRAPLFDAARTRGLAERRPILVRFAPRGGYAAKKGAINPGFRGHKKPKGDKSVAFCDRHCNVIAPFVAVAGNRKAQFDPAFFEERILTIEWLFPCEVKFRRLLLRFNPLSPLHYALKTLAYAMINLRHYCRG